MLEILMAFAPLIFLIVYALKTRRMAESMVLATLLAMALLHRQHFLTGTIDGLYAVLSSSSYQFALCVIIGFGGMITLFQESGALMGFRDLLLKVGAFPKLGPLKQAYQRVRSGGPAFEKKEKAEKLVDIADVDESRVSPAWNAVVPLAVLVGGTILFGNDLVHGMVLAIIAQFLLYVPQRIMTVKQFFEHFFNGAKGMTSLAIVVCFGFMLSEANRQLGLFDILINSIGSAVPAAMVPPLAFLLVGATVFAVGGCWVVMTIAIPVFVPLALSTGVAAPVIIAAVMSGIALGYSTCFYADAVFMTTAGTGVSSITIIRTTVPYATVGAAVAVIGFLLCGLGVL